MLRIGGLTRGAPGHNDAVASTKPRAADQLIELKIIGDGMGRMLLLHIGKNFDVLRAPMLSVTQQWSGRGFKHHAFIRDVGIGKMFRPYEMKRRRVGHRQGFKIGRGENLQSNGNADRSANLHRHRGHGRDDLGPTWPHR